MRGTEEKSGESAEMGVMGTGRRKKEDNVRESVLVGGMVDGKWKEKWMSGRHNVSVVRKEH